MRILVVEDEPAAATVLAKGLREHTYAVDVAADGPAALEQAGINDYDLIVLDVLMPGMNGLEVCRRLRADGITAPVLMLTARGEPDQRVEGLDVGADDYLAKPYHFPELLEVYIQRLRLKVDDGHRVKLLQTRRGAGYAIQAAHDESAAD